MGSSTVGFRAAAAARSWSCRRPASRAIAPHAEALAAGVTLELGSPPWLFVERKGPSVAFHVRQADDIPAARAAVLAAISAVEERAGLGDHGLAPYRGRSVVDLRPRDAGGKREAAARLIATARRRRGHLVRRRPERHGRLRCGDRGARRRAAGGGTHRRGPRPGQHAAGDPDARRPRRRVGAGRGPLLAAIARRARARGLDRLGSDPRDGRGGLRPTICSSGSREQARAGSSRSSRPPGRPTAAGPWRSAGASRRRVAHEHVDDDAQVVERGGRGVEDRDDREERQRPAGLDRGRITYALAKKPAVGGMPVSDSRNSVMQDRRGSARLRPSPANVSSCEVTPVPLLERGDDRERAEVHERVGGA